MHNSFLSLNRIINSLSSSLNIASKVLPLYEKSKPVLSNIKKIISIINNQDGHKKSTVTTNSALISHQTKVNNPTFFK